MYTRTMAHDNHRLGSWKLTVTDIIEKLVVQEDPHLNYEMDPHQALFLFRTAGHTWEITEMALKGEPSLAALRSTSDNFIGLCQGFITESVRIRALRLKIEAADPPTLWDHLLETA